MSGRLKRPVVEPIRPEMDWTATWRGPDSGLIYCWERGRVARVDGVRVFGDADMAKQIIAAAERGELPSLPWKGGTSADMTPQTRKTGTLQYLAMCRGLGNEDLDLDLDGVTAIVCAATRARVAFQSQVPDDEEASVTDGAHLVAEELYGAPTGAEE